MDDAQYKEWMTRAGWKAYKVGKATHFEMKLKDRVLRVPGHYKQLSDELFFDDHANVWFKDYANTKHSLFPDIPVRGCFLAFRPNASSSTPGKGSFEFFEDLTKTLVDWAKNVDREAEIAKHAEMRERFGQFSFDHIAALAMTGDTEQLEQWRETVLGGDTSRLLPMITVSVLEQALDIARGNRS